MKYKNNKTGKIYRQICIENANATKQGWHMQGIYYKVYQDIDNRDGRYYVDDLEGILRSIKHWREGVAENDEVKWPVFEPVEMTEAEFKSLPEFTGY